MDLEPSRAEGIPTPPYLAKFSPKPEKIGLDLVFIHHSCGSNWLADWNGGLAKELTQAGFHVHDATYGSKVGEKTDVIHWYPKFSTMMDLVLRTKKQDQLLEKGRRNRIVMFKSCFPNSALHKPGKTDWDPLGIMTVANYKLAYNSLLPIFRKYPDVLFIAVTAPPLRKEDTNPESAALAKEFNHWLVNEWPAKDKNVAAFDFFGILSTKEGWLRYPTEDSHPNKLGNRRATKAFLPFLFRALRRAGLIREE
ncbi:MAG TPA: SGNH/GDSL hydrolase family protein [Planctomycetes bacterium]|nr:SGNH/GDSL hydrolase family protein [Planctomycetota bacterium]